MTSLGLIAAALPCTSAIVYLFWMLRQSDREKRLVVGDASYDQSGVLRSLCNR